ncbi:MAG TPA: hypothetical protein VMJ64_00375, partial [Anaerolineales bacterium]|nr:hypothetical protein [Anaerolineales bacterium]
MRASSQDTYDRARRWLASLGTLCAGAMPLEEAQARVAAFASMLCEQYGGEAFTQASLQTVARGCRFFPSYGELCEALSAWLKENPPPRHTAIAGPSGGE